MSAVLPLAPLAILVTVVVVGYLRNRDRLFEVGRALQNKRAFAVESVLAPRHVIEPVPAAFGGRLDGDQLEDAIDRLTAYARKLSPDWIVGVHPGGRLLSVLVADAIGAPRESCLFVRTSSRRTSRIAFEPQRYKSNRRPEGSMLIIDDISRTGKTLQTIKRFLIASNYRMIDEDGKERSSSEHELMYRLTAVHFGVLLVVNASEADVVDFRPDWVRYATTDKFFRLPWSDLSSRIGEAFANRRAGLEYDSDVISQHECLAVDYDYALDLARQYVSMNVVETPETTWSTRFSLSSFKTSTHFRRKE